jgi:hypothetical protein
MTSHHGNSVEDEMVDQWPSDAKFQMGDYVAKKGRALWRGKIVGWYRTDVTKLGYVRWTPSLGPGTVEIKV